MTKSRIIPLTFAVAVLISLLFTSASEGEQYDFVTKWGTFGLVSSAHPRGVAVDSAGNVYVVDTSNHRIQKFTSDGVFLTKWGIRGSGDGQFQHPHGVAVDSAGNVYVAEYYNHRIQKFKPAFAITAAAGANGSISPSGAVTLDYGANQTFTITPDSHYHVADVLVDGASVGAVGTYTFTNVTADHTIHATFAIDTHTITATAGDNGSISPSDAVIVNCGSGQAFTIAPDSHYHVADVLVDSVSVGAVGTYTFTNVTANHTINATFAIDTHAITASTGDNGSISPSGAVIVNCGSDQAFTIAPDTCYHIGDVLVDGVSVKDDVVIDSETGTGTYTFTNILADHTVHATFEVDKLELTEDHPASYDVLDTTLLLKFNKTIRPHLTCFDGIGMEISDSGEWDIVLSDALGLIAVADSADPSKVAIDINHSHATCVNLALAAFADRRKVDLMLQAGAFTDTCNVKNEPVDGTVRVHFMADGLAMGTVGDVSGDGNVTAYDAALLLESTIDGQTVFPIYQAGTEISEWLTAAGHPCDVVMDTADMSRDGKVSAYDAALVLRQASGLSAPSPITSGPKVCRLNIDSYDGQTLDISIDLDDMRDAYSADIIMTFDPNLTTVADVSRTSSTSEWLIANGVESGKLRISMAGASQPAMAGELVTVSFDAASMDAIGKLDIVELNLNGGLLNVIVQKLPKAFALLQNYPNPFNPETWIPYQLSEPADVAITIYNVNGQMVRRLDLGSKMPGHYIDRSRAVYWDGRNESDEMVSSGVYFYQLQAGRDVSVRKMIIVK